ncbi:MAG: oxidoreductase [Nakamurella sp.]
MTSAWPDLTAGPGIEAAVEEARDALAALALHPTNRRGWPTSAAAAGIRAARASAALDGGDPGLDSEVDVVTDPVLAGAIRCSAAVGTLAPVFGRAPLQALARLHTLAAADLTEPADLGRPVADPEIAGRLSGIAAMVAGSRWPAPILVSVVHAEIAVLEPFRGGNGVVARAAARLAAVHTGLDPHALGVPEVACLRRGDRYRELLDGYRSGAAGALDAWLLFGCQALTAGAREGRSIADAQRG